MAENDTQEQPVVIVRKKSRHKGGHGGAWKVAYADFVTAMMAFFLVMWLVNQSDIVKQAVQNYFNNPAGFMKGAGTSGVLKGQSKPFKGEKDNLQDSPLKPKNEREMLLEIGARVQKALEDLPELSSLMDFIEIEITREGLRIQLIDASEKGESNFFDLGSARLKPKTSLLLKAVAVELGKIPNYIVIEGHTDSRPYLARDDYSNWELSADRANSARKLMESSGLRDGQVVEIRGFADRMPRFVENTADPRNRRVGIIVLNEEAARYYRNV
jgi:chemotaxis protein MotB